MSFLNPILLFGIAAVSAPILIHLLNKRKFEKVVWGAMRFLQISVEQTQRRLQLEDILLLLLRCLLVTLIALALARPALRGASAAGFFGEGKVTSVIVIDNSYSMSQTDGVSSAFDRAKKAAMEALGSLPAGSSAGLILASDISQGVIPEPTYDLNFVRKNIETAALCDRSTDLMPALSDAVQMLKRKLGKREIYVATDGQLGGFRQMDAIRKLLDDSKPDIRVHVLLVGTAEQQNLGISDMKTMTEIPAVDQPIKFAIQVTNFGLVDAASVHVNLKVDNDPPCDEGTIDTLAQGQTKVITLFARLRSDSYHTITAWIPADRLPADDSRTLAVRAVKSVNVLMVDGSAGTEPRDAETFFLRHALVPVTRAETDRYFVKASVISPRDLTNQSIDDSDVVVLCDVPDLQPAMIESLASYLRRGNALMVFPGPKIDVSFYNDVLEKKWGFLPATFGDPVGDATQTGKFIMLQRNHFTHPIVELWNDSASGDPAAAHFFRSFPLAPLAAPAEQPDAGESRLVASFADSASTPAMMERAWGAGHVIQFSSTANTLWNDLPAHAGLYVPLMRRTLGWALQQQDRTLNVTVGDTFVLHPAADTLNLDATITRTGSDQKSTRPVEFLNHLPTLSFSDTGVAGPYDVDLAGKAYKFAVQQRSTTSVVDSESSLLDLAPPQIEKLSASADVVLPGQSLAEKAGNERSGAEFWYPLILVALALASAETFLAYWFSVPK